RGTPSAARREAVGEDALRGADAAAELDRDAEAVQRELERRDSGDDVERADVAEMRDADHLALQAILSARERDPHAVAEVPEDRRAVDPVGEHDRRRGRARRFG